MNPLANTHLHLPPNFSAFASVEQAVELAAEAGIVVLGVSNYYQFEVYDQFARLARARGIHPLFGLEITCLDEELRAAGVKVNDPGNPGKIYLCGKGIARYAAPNETAAALLDTSRRHDGERMAAMVDRLEACFVAGGTAPELDAATIASSLDASGYVTLQERHLARAFQERFFAVVPAADRDARLAAILGAGSRDADDAGGVQEEIRAHLMKAGKPAFVPERFLSFEDAKRLILELGGIPCYPTLADGASVLCPFEEDPERLVERILERGLHAAELIPHRNDLAVLRRYVEAMRAAGLVVTAGTEHNTRALLPLAPRARDAELPEDLQAIFWEGACVVAAHQDFVARGTCGYVDGAGDPHPDHSDPEARIRAFAAHGADLVTS